MDALLPAAASMLASLCSMVPASSPAWWGLSAVAPITDPWTSTGEGQLRASDAAPGDQFGWSVAIDQDTLVIGAARDNHAPGAAGASDGEGSAYVFTRTGSSWSESAKLVASDPVAWGALGWSVAISDGTLAVGKPGFLGTGGAVYVFVGSGSTWTQQAKLEGDAFISTGQFGYDVALNGDTLIVGAPEETFFDGSQWLGGAAYLFERTGTTWGPPVKHRPAGGGIGGHYGRSVALDGDLALVGAPQWSQSSGLQGAAFLYERNGGAWDVAHMLQPNDSAEGDQFGDSVALGGGSALVGSFLDDDGSTTFDDIGGLAIGLASDQLYSARNYFSTHTASDATGTFVGGEGLDSIEGLATDVAGQVVYALSNLSSQLLTIDPATGEATVATLLSSGPHNAHGLAFDANSSALYSVAHASSRLLIIDVGSGATTTFGSIGQLGFFDVEGLAFDAGSGTLYGADSATDQLITIDLATGVGTAVGPLGHGGVTSLAFDDATGTLYGVDEASHQLLTIDTVTGSATPVGVLTGRPYFDVGSAYEFRRNGASWTQASKLVAGTRDDDDHFGWDVAMVAGRAVIAAQDSVDQNEGTAHVFARKGGSWSQELVLEPAPKGVGSSIASSDDRVLLGAFLHSFNGKASAGAALAYRLDAEVSSYCTAGSSANGCTAELGWSGTPSATAVSGFTLQASAVDGARAGLYFFGTNGRQAMPWGTGTSYQCVSPPVRRATLAQSGGSVGACDGTFQADLNALWCPTCPKPQHNPGAGALVQAQLWFRDPFNTSNQSTSLSDAVEFTVSP